ncbi:MAG: hypothetical protein GY853_16735 [PVC group bacterium]|nr:hypothetical protein [PVC group bacterium]
MAYRRRINNPRQEPNDICWIFISDKGAGYFNWLKEEDKDEYLDMLNDIGVLMRKVHSWIYARRMDYGVLKYIPSKTGALRENYASSLEAKNQILPRATPRGLKDLVLRIGYYTTLKYAEYVKKLPTKSLSHGRGGKNPDKFGYVGKKEKVELKDKHAEVNFEKKSSDALRKIAQLNTRRMMNILANTWGWTPQEVRWLFKTKDFGFTMGSTAVKYG